jgi:hypothetical protein
MNETMMASPRYAYMAPSVESYRSSIDPALILLSQSGNTFAESSMNFDSHHPQTSWHENNLLSPAQHLPLPKTTSDSSSGFSKSNTSQSDDATSSPDDEQAAAHRFWYPSPDGLTSPELAWVDFEEPGSPDSLSSNTKYFATERNGSVISNLPSQLDTQQTHTTVGRRQWEDNFIVEGRKKGWTYKEIIRKGGFKCAESTIRGRHRSIIKPKSERLRRPIWKPIDEHLLLEAVERMSSKDRIKRVKARDNMQELAVIWLEVGKYIKKHGGTYKFGPFTCKQKWMQLTGITE